MKRNESILVYSVTGLLVVILAVAILFGNEHGAQAQTARAKPLDELAGVNTAGDDGGSVPSPGSGSQPGSAPEPTASPAVTPATGRPAEQATGSEPVPATDGKTGVPAAAPPATGADLPVSAALNAPVKPPAAVPETSDLATQALMWLGDSKRDGQYRVVTVRKGDTFSELVQRWCGGLDQLEIAESLNEELNLRRLEQGTKVLLPWVDDAKLVAAHIARKQKQEADVKVVTEARGKGVEHVVKPGDKLWNIAVAAVGQKNAAKFIEEVKALNPELMADPSKLVVGKTIILPR